MDGAECRADFFHQRCSLRSSHRLSCPPSQATSWESEHEEYLDDKSPHNDNRHPNFHNRYGYGVYGVQRRFPSGSPPVDVVFVNAGPVPLQLMVSTCQSAKRALIFVRLLCVPPWALPPGGVLTWART